MMDKLFDGSNAHLLPGNAELIANLRGENLECNCCAYSYRECSCDTCWPERFTNKAADALEAADKLIAELEKYGRVQDPLAQRIAKLEVEIIGWKADQKENMATAVEECKRANESERKLAVAQEALKNLFLSSPIALECNDMHHAKKDQHEYDEDCPVLSRYEDALSGAREALAQIGGDDAG